MAAASDRHRPPDLCRALVKRTIDKIQELKGRYRLTVLVAEQNFDPAVCIADRVYVIVHGRIAFAGAPADELENNELVRKFYLGLSKYILFPRQLQDQRLSAVTGTSAPAAHRSLR
jgi:ABC-type multidrug transport system ATPase subunit